MLSCGFRLADGRSCSWTADDVCRPAITAFAGAANMELAEKSTEGASYYLPEKWQMKGERLRALFYSGLLPLLETGQIGVYHGILVNNILICGVSGVGKSTLCRRLDGIADIYADDAVLLQVISGVLKAKPCPTWSRYIRNIDARSSCDINTTVEVEKILFLERGDTPGVFPIQPSLLTAKFMRASTDLYYRIFSGVLPAGRLAALSSAQLSLAGTIRSVCGAARVATPLNQPLPEDLLILLNA